MGMSYLRFSTDFKNFYWSWEVRLVDSLNKKLFTVMNYTIFGPEKVQN